MANIPLLPQRRFTLTKDIGKQNSTGLMFNLIQSYDLFSSKTYYNNPTSFLATSTATPTISSYDTSNDVVGTEFNASYLNQATKPYLTEFVRAYNLAPVANAQIDQAVTMDLVTNDIVRVAFYSNYPSASVQLRLSSDATYTNYIQFAITGSTTNIGTTANPIYRTVQDLKVGAGSTVFGTPVLNNIIRSRFIGINQTATNRVAPVAVLGANNYSSLAGSVLSWKACCLENFSLEREMETSELKCGRSVVGEVATSDSWTLKFETMEENNDLYALSVGTYTQIAPRTVFENVTGYGVGNNTSKILADVALAPTRGQIQLATNLQINSVQINCSNLQSVNFSTAITTSANQLLGSGQYSYDPITGLMYFNSNDIGLAPEITVLTTKDVLVTEPEPLRLGYIGSFLIQEVNNEGKFRYFYVKKAQLKFPSMSFEDEGTKLEFEMKAFFSKKGDVAIYHSL